MKLPIILANTNTLFNSTLEWIWLHLVKSIDLDVTSDMTKGFDDNGS